MVMGKWIKSCLLSATYIYVYVNLCHFTLCVVFDNSDFCGVWYLVIVRCCVSCLVMVEGVVRQWYVECRSTRDGQCQCRANLWERWEVTPSGGLLDWKRELRMGVRVVRKRRGPTNLDAIIRERLLVLVTSLSINQWPPFYIIKMVGPHILF